MDVQYRWMLVTAVHRWTRPNGEVKTTVRLESGGCALVLRDVAPTHELPELGDRYKVTVQLEEPRRRYQL